MEWKAKRYSKDTVFRDFFSDRKNLYRLFRERHPEMTEVTEEDIVPVTLNPVLMNMQQNDLAFLVRECNEGEGTEGNSGQTVTRKAQKPRRYKLLILAEAQATWTLNILVRLLLYLTAEYQRYISTHSLYLFGTKLVALPEPEFIVVYCGAKRVEGIKEEISLREDVFHNPKAKLDLIASVVHAPEKNGILGEYIQFCRIRDEQVKDHGLTLYAIEETIRICKDRNVMRTYLEAREKEEIFSMVQAMFTEEYNRRAIAKSIRRSREEGIEEGREKGIREGREKGIREGERIGAIRAFIESWQELGKSYGETADRLGSKFGMNGSAVQESMEKYWYGKEQQG